MPLDNALPFLVALLSHHRDADVTLISSDRNFRGIIENEPLIRDTIRKFDIDVVSPEGSKGWAYRLRLGRLAWRIAKASVKHRVLFVNSSQLAKGQRFLRWMMTINRRLHGGLTVEMNLVPSSARLDQFFKDALNRHYQRTMGSPTVPVCDVFLSSLPESAYASIGAGRFLRTGYGRGFQSWIDEVRLSLSSMDPAIGDDFIFWPLSVLTRREKNQMIDLRPVILKTLKVMMDVGLKSQIVFRYHPTTDREKFREILERSGFRNYVITFAHPHQLMQKCRFVFSNSGSSLFSDAYFFNMPVIQYTPTQDSFCIADDNGVPIASIFQPVVTRFFSSETEFASFLTSISSGGGRVVGPSHVDDEDYAMTDREAERKLFSAILGQDTQRLSKDGCGG